MLLQSLIKKLPPHFQSLFVPDTSDANEQFSQEAIELVKTDLLFIAAKVYNWKESNVNPEQAISQRFAYNMKLNIVRNSSTGRKCISRKEYNM